MTFKTIIKIGYYHLELLTSEAMKLLGSTKNKIAKKSENVPHLKITEVVFVHYNIVNNGYQLINKIQEFCINLIQINHLAVY